jgi:hypothetical protein
MPMPWAEGPPMLQCDRGVLQVTQQRTAVSRRTKWGGLTVNGRDAPRRRG